MGIPQAVLPTDAPVIPIALQASVDMTSEWLDIATPNEYTLAVYNLGGHNVALWGQDAPGAPLVPGGDPPLPYFANLRRELKVMSFVPGVVSSTSDEGTSTSLLNPDFMKTLSMQDTILVKTPWGRQWMAFAQQIGTLWGLS